MMPCHSLNLWLHAHPSSRQVLKKFKHDRLETLGAIEIRPFHEWLSDIEAVLFATA